MGIQGIGHRVVDSIWRLGYASRFFLLTLLKSGTSFRRFDLIIRELYFTGVLSLIIIIVSGLFVGMVLGLQGYETLQRFGAESAVGTMVALSLVRELGPVVAALLFASRAGSAITAEIGLIKVSSLRREDGKQNEAAESPCKRSLVRLRFIESIVFGCGVLKPDGRARRLGSFPFLSDRFFRHWWNRIRDL